MKKTLLFIAGIFIITGIWIYSYHPKQETNLGSFGILKENQTDEPDQSRILFVPYWTIGKEAIVSDTFDRLIYFGITPTLEGIDTTEDGYKNLKNFNRFADNRRDKYLTIRMLNSKTNFSILENKEAQKKIIDESIVVAKDNSFSGIVLDLEVVSLPFDSIISQINDFSKSFYASSKTNKLEFSIMMYGDVFYRIRPYDVKTLGKNADSIYIMSYDFHKSGGNPGPNFPLAGKEKYGYDFKTMVDDFSKIIGKEKMIIVFGLFGYDWTVDEKNISMGQADALSLHNAKKRFLKDCQFLDCIATRNSVAAEIEITYKDIQNKPHIVWFEDESSIQKKKEYLKEKGVTKTAFWAYSYF